MKQNPYAASKVASVSVDAADAEAVKRIVRPPAIALIMLSAVAMLLETVPLVIAITDVVYILSAGGFDERMLWGYTGLAVCCLLLFTHLMILIGAVKMYRLRGYMSAQLAAVLALIPICSPLVWVGIPFAIWALIVLSKSDVQSGFRRSFQESAGRSLDA